MWNTESSRKAVLAEGRYVEAENGHCGRQKLSSGMAMVLGALLTMEIMLGGAMLFNFDFRGADIVAVVIHGIIFCSGGITDRQVEERRERGCQGSLTRRLKFYI